jgi:hypothetical protein
VRQLTSTRRIQLRPFPSKRALNMMQLAGNGTHGGRRKTRPLLARRAQGRLGKHPRSRRLGQKEGLECRIRADRHTRHRGHFQRLLGTLHNSKLGGGRGAARAVAFVWGIIQTQAKMYRELAAQPSAPAVVAPAQLDRTKAADFEKWRHVETLELPKAAQLWEGERPGIALRGRAAETYAMLCGAIKKGELTFITSATSNDASFLDTAHQMERSDPQTYTKVTRAGLKAFAAKYGYDPEFLRDRTGGAA